MGRAVVDSYRREQPMCLYQDGTLGRLGQFPKTPRFSPFANGARIGARTDMNARQCLRRSIAAQIAFVALAATLPSLAATSACTSATENDRTRYRYNPIVMTHPAVRAVRGVVTAPDGRPMDDVLVEVFDHPEVVMERGQAKPAQHRIAACITTGTGRFFVKVPSGSCEVRFSKSSREGWECTSILVRVRRLSLRGGFRVMMALAT